jgi:hypothetical protein
MAKTVQFRRDTTANLAAETGAPGELFVDTSKNVVVVMDGSTAGGFPSLNPIVSAEYCGSIKTSIGIGDGITVGSPNSVVIGKNAVSCYASAFGFGAYETSSIVIGWGARSQSACTIMIGRNAGGPPCSLYIACESTVIGHCSYSNGYGAIVLGLGSSATNQSIVIGSGVNLASTCSIIAIGGCIATVGSSSGYPCTATESVVIGNTTTVAPYSVSIGNQSMAKGERSTAVGHSAKSEVCQYSPYAACGIEGGTAIGAHSKVIGNYGIHIGSGYNTYQCNYVESYSVGVGHCIIAGWRAAGTSDQAVAIGAYVHATGYDSVAIGSSINYPWGATCQTGDKSVRIGHCISCISPHSIAIGRSINGSSCNDNNIVIGQNNYAGFDVKNVIVLGRCINICCASSSSSTFISPIRNASTAYHLYYNPTTKEVTYS